MKNLLKISATLALIIILAIIPGFISYADYTRVSESVNMREKPTTDSKVLKLVPMGYEIAVLEKGGEWTKASFEGVTGYVKNDFIEVIKGSAPASAQAGAPQEPPAAPKSDSAPKTTDTKASGGTPGGGSSGTPGDGSGAGQGSDGGALMFNSEGDAVRELQKLLTDKGYYAGPINGKFGPLTEEAVIKYQEESGLLPDGVVGSETLKKLKEKPHPPGTYRNGDEGDEVKKLQKALKDKNYYTGPVNGKFGPLTEEAVKIFQQANNLEVDGIVGKETLELINAPPKNTKSENSAKSSASGSGSGSSSGSGSGSSKTPKSAPNGVELIEWGEAQNILKIGLTARIYDVRTGIVYNVRSFSNGKHADVEPVTTEDTQMLKKTYGGRWSWDPRPVWVTVNGRTIAASINGMPHGGGVNPSNGMDGQVCLHFYGSSTHNNNMTFARQHQDAVMEAWNAARR